ncbi:MAG: hypothetical protein HYU41_21260 [Candidatus Rokubacteria bacterium]|nr:hypothetical protein [Candidatus Rokubacteria bacterium]
MLHPVGDEDVGVAERSEGMAQAVACLRRAGVNPQQGSELVPGMALAGVEGEVREQRLGLGGQGESGSGREPELEAAQQVEAEALHGDRPVS